MSIDTKKKILRAYAEGKIKSEQDLKEFLIQEKAEEKFKEVMEKIEAIKPVDISHLEKELAVVKEKLEEPVEVELEIE